MKMRSKINNLLYIALGCFVFVSCEPEINVPAPSSGSADFTRFVSVGNSLTAGFSDGGLYADVQMQSFPALIAQKMNEVTPSEFLQPDIQGTGSGYLTVTDLDLTTNPPDVTFSIVEEDANWLQQLEGPFNNLGVPGIRVKDITVEGYGASPEQGNPYFYRMLGGSSPTTSYLKFVEANRGTFFTSWIGNNDVLGYATSGGVFGISGRPGTGLDGLTDPDTEFKPSYDALIATLSANGTKGVVVTIPDVTLTPFFTTVPWNGLVLDEQLAALANQFYLFSIDTTVQKRVETEVFLGAATQQVYQGAYQQAIANGATPEEAEAIATAYVESTEGQQDIANANQLIADSYYSLPEDQRPNHPLYPIIEEQKNQAMQLLDFLGLIPTFSAGPNPFVIEVPVTPTNPLGIRQMVEGELVLLTALLAGELDGTNALIPKTNQYILTSEEVANVDSYTDEYNEIIRSYASSPDIAVLESNPVLEEVQTGIFVDGVTVTGEFLTGGAFSLDGIHLTPRGYAIFANSLIDVINSNFNARLSPVIVNNHRAVILP